MVLSVADAPVPIARMPLLIADPDDSRRQRPGLRVDALSARETQVLALLCEGRANKDIARALGISYQTVKNHLTSLMAKTGTHGRTELVLCALQKQMVVVEEKNQ